MMNKFKYYFTIWRKYTINAFSIEFYSRFVAVFFLLGKLIRLFFFLWFLLILVNTSKNLGGFTIYQVAFFYLTFNLIDTTTQLLYRQVYAFRPMVVEGRFDYILLQPGSSLFRVLAGGADFLDLLMLPPILISLVVVALKLPAITWGGVILYLFLLVNSLILTTAFHIIVLAIGILTTTVDHTIMIYRDIVSMGRIPVDVYKEPLRGLITFVIPVGIIMTVPAKALMGVLSWPFVVFSFVIGALFFYLSLRLWKYALTQYSSASS